MIPIPSALLPNVDIFQSLPDFDSAKSQTELMTDRLVRTGLYFHKMKRTAGIDPARISTEMTSAASNIMAVYKERVESEYSSGVSPHFSDSQRVAEFILRLEEGSYSKESLAREFQSLSLDRHSEVFLLQHVSRLLAISSNEARDRIQADPYLLLEIQNDKNENIVEVLLQRLLQRASILPTLESIQYYSEYSSKDLLIELERSGHFSLFCWYVWYSRGGKDDPNFGNSTYGEDQIKGNPKILFEGRPSLIEEMISSFHSLDRNTQDPFHLVEKQEDNRDRHSVMVEMIKLFAQQDMRSALKYISRPGISLYFDSKELLEVAKICIEQDMKYVLQNLIAFNQLLSDRESRLELAKFCAGKDAYLANRYVNSFGLDPNTDSKELIELITVLANRAAGLTTRSIKDVGINIKDPKNQPFLIECAKVCAEQDGWKTGYCIEDFHIDPKSNQQVLVEIAKRCVIQAGSRIAHIIKSFGIDPIAGQEELRKIAKLCFNCDPVGDLLLYLKNFNLSSQEIVDSLAILSLMKVLLRDDYLNEASRFRPWLDTYLAVDISQFYSEGSKILTSLQKEKQESATSLEGSPVRLNYHLHHLMALCIGKTAKLLTTPAGVAGSNAVVHERLEDTLEKIFKVRNRSLQIYLTSVLANVAQDPDLIEKFSSLVKPGGTLHKPVGFEYALPILLSVASWCKDIPPDEFENVKTLVRATLSSIKDPIKDARKGLNITFFRTIKDLEEDLLSMRDKLHLFTEICRLNQGQAKVERFEKCLKYLQLLCQRGFFLKGLPDAFSRELSFKLLEDPCIEHSKMALFGDEPLTADLERLLESNYLDLCARQRSPFALELYAGRIRSLGDAGLKRQMTRFISNVLDGSFSKQRYDVTLSPHIEAIHETFPDLWSRWQVLPEVIELNTPRDLTGRSSAGVAAGAAVVAAASASAVSLHERESYLWLKEKLLTDRHFDSLGTLPTEINSYLFDESMYGNEESILASLNDKVAYPQMQRLCFSLCKKGITLNQTKAILTQLRDLVSADSSLKDSQWHRDINDRLILLSTEQKKGDFQVSITDNWQDLFLCGTEILGSCQRIDGDLDKNKCLLGYCLDGKIQMAAVKDKESGKIVSRALLKLLFRNEGGKLVPCLFLERIYPNSCSAEQLDALNALAMQRAQDLGVELYTINQNVPKERDSVPLQSLGCPAPFEYEDGGVGVSEGGKYTISGYKVRI